MIEEACERNEQGFVSLNECLLDIVILYTDASVFHVSMWEYLVNVFTIIIIPLSLWCFHKHSPV